MAQLLLLRFKSEHKSSHNDSKPLIIVVIMVSSLIYEVLVSIGFSRDLCIADFCLPRCKVTVSEAELNAGKVKIASDDLSPNDHCFIKINHPAESIFVRFDEVKSSYSFSQIMWNVRGREKIEELNSFHLDRHWLEWREIEPLSDDPGKIY